MPLGKAVLIGYFAYIIEKSAGFMTDYIDAAARLLAEVGLTFDDVFDLGRPSADERFGLQVGPKWRFALRGVCDYPIPSNPTSRKRCLISLTGPVDCDEMLMILAHECGHASKRFSVSVPLYEQEYFAEIYAKAAFERVAGREPAREIIEAGKRYVRNHCKRRFKEMGTHPTKGWRRDIIEWCGFKPKVELGGLH